METTNDKVRIIRRKQENLTDVTKEWNSKKLDSVQTDPDGWFSLLLHINAKFGKIKTFYKKDEEMMKSHVLANPPTEYAAVIKKSSHQFLHYIVLFMRFQNCYHDIHSKLETWYLDRGLGVNFDMSFQDNLYILDSMDHNQIL